MTRRELLQLSVMAAMASSALLDADGKLTRLGECYRDA